MLKILHFLFLIQIVFFSFAQNNFATLRAKALNFIEINDAENAIVTLEKIITNYKKTPNAVLDVYLLRSKLNTAIGKYDLAEKDLDTYLFYDSSCASVYIDKITLIDNQLNKLSILNKALEKIPNDETLLIQKCIVKIGITSSFWQEQNNFALGFNNAQALKEIYIAKNGCAELLNIAINNKDANQLYNKICKINDIKNF